MSILKFLLSPLLNEHGYITLPTASIASGKPVTTGIFANIKASLDGFNDGTGIADNVISGRQASKLRQHYAMFSATTLPVGWTQTAGVSTFGALASGASVYCVIPTSAGTPWITLNEFSRWYMTDFASGRYSRMRIDVLVAWDVTTATAKLLGVLSGTGANGCIAISPNGANQILCRVINDAGTAFDQSIAQAWAANTLYKVSIDFGVNDAKFYFNDTLIATDTTAAHFPSTVVLIPSIQSWNTSGTQYVHDYCVTLY